MYTNDNLRKLVEDYNAYILDCKNKNEKPLGFLKYILESAK